MSARDDVLRGLRGTAPAPRRVADQMLDAHRAEVIREVAARLGDGMFWFDARDRTSAIATVLSLAPAATPQSMCRCGHPEFRHAPFAVVDNPAVQCVVCAAGDRDDYQHPYTPTTTQEQ